MCVSRWESAMWKCHVELPRGSAELDTLVMTWKCHVELPRGTATWNCHSDPSSRTDNVDILPHGIATCNCHVELPHGTKFHLINFSFSFKSQVLTIPN